MTECWWSCLYDEAGQLVEVKLVAEAGTDAGGLFFVRAATEEQATKRASRKFDAERMKKKRIEWKAAGLCTKCGRNRDAEGHSYCSVCLSNKSAENARAWRRSKGEDVAAPSRVEGDKRRREADRAVVELELLEEADSVWAERGAVGLRQWLRGKLDALRARRVA